MTALWSDYIFKLCSACGRMAHHDRYAAKCRNCQMRRLEND